jgi:hypothetical protein
MIGDKMKSDNRFEFVARDKILSLLSDDDIASVSNAETAAHLSDGDEYIDLEQLDQGVRRAPPSAAVMGRVLPRKAVKEITWSKILTQLASPRSP